MRCQAARHRAGRFRAGPEPAVLAGPGSAQRRFGVAAEHRRQRTLIAGRGAQPVDGKRQSVLRLRLLRAGFAVALQGGIFAFAAGQLGPGGRQRRRGIIAGRLHLCFARLLRIQRGAHFGEGRCRLFALRAGSGDGGIGLAILAQRGQRCGVPRGFLLKPLQPRARLRKFGLGDAPFGFDPGLGGGGLSLLQLGGTGGALRPFERCGESRALGLGSSALRFAAGQFAFEPGQRIGSILSQPASFAAIRFEPFALAVEIGEALLGAFQLARQRRHPVAVGGRIVAAVGKRIAGFGKRLSGGMLGALGRLGFRLRCGNLRFGGERFGPSGIGSRGRIAPAGEDQPGLGQPDLVRQRLVAIGRAGLAAE